MRTASMTAVLTGLATSGAALAGDTVDFTMRTVALIGDAAPGADGAYFVEFVSPVINATGDVCFRATLGGADVDESNDEGIWAQRGGVLSLVVREGDAAPGIDGAMISAFELLPAFNNTGAVALKAMLSGAGVDDQSNESLWRSDGESLSLIAREGDSPPDAAGAAFAYFHPPAMNNLGIVAFRAGLRGDAIDASNDVGIWVGAPGGLSAFIREGDAAPGMQGVFGPIGISTQGEQIDAEGRSVAMASVIDPLSNQALTSGVWFGSPGLVELLLKVGDPAPGLNGASFSGVQTVRLGSEGRMGIEATFPGMFANTTGVWRLSQDDFTLVAAGGADAPGAPGQQFSGINILGLNANGGGRVTFWSHLSSSSNGPPSGTWSTVSGSLESLALFGAPAPGTDAFFGPVHGPTPLTFLNDVGQTALFGSLIGLNVNDDNEAAIWLTQPSGVTSLILRLGGPLRISMGDGTSEAKLIDQYSAITGASHDNGKACSFNDRSELSLAIRFTDGSGGVFVLQLPRPCLYDLNADGVVDGADLQNLLINWGGDSAAVVGPIGGVELSELLATWGPCDD